MDGVDSQSFACTSIFVSLLVCHFYTLCGAWGGEGAGGLNAGPATDQPNLLASLLKTFFCYGLTALQLSVWYNYTLYVINGEVGGDGTRSFFVLGPSWEL